VKERPIYLDYAATTPVDPAVAHAMSACLGEDGAFGNASSATHEFGRRAAEVVEKARTQIAQFIGAEPDEIVFTSGATESSNLAILGIARANVHRGRHLLTARTEHKAVLDPCKRLEKEGFDVTYLVPGPSGVLDPAAVRAAIRPDTVLVSLMHVNNETGAIQDIAAIGAASRELDVPFHVDAAQSAGKLPLDVEAMPLDLMSFTAHKIYGPKGIGALYVRRAVRPRLQAVSFGGGQERGLRPGTLPTHQIAGFAAACAWAAQRRESDAARWATLRDRLWRGLAGLQGAHLNAESAPRVPGILNVSFEGVEGESLVTGLSELALSTGSACSSASGEPSYVLRALGRDTALAQSSLRFSFGRPTREADIDIAVAAVRREILRLRALSPASADSMFPPAAGRIVRGDAGSPAQEAWVRFHLLVDGHVVKDARFQAYGCPHTLAVAAWIAGQLAGRPRDDLVGEGPQSWAREHSVPVEKLGRLLVIEDALNDALQHWTQSP
jgi:cysteine desulfurase